MKTTRTRFALLYVWSWFAYWLLKITPYGLPKVWSWLMGEAVLYSYRITYDEWSVGK